MNIHSLYVTRSIQEREYFYKLLEFTLQFKNYIKIVHLDFKWDDEYDNMKYNNHLIVANVYTNGQLKIINIYNFEDLVKLFEIKINGNRNVFVYSGHSNGLFLMKHNIRILRVEDFCELSFRTLNKKADCIIFDCCLCGNINVLNISFDFTDYLIGSTSYWSEFSILHTKAIYGNGDTVKLLKNSIKEFITIEKNQKDPFITDIMLYQLNDSVKKLINLVIQYKDYFKDFNYIIDKRYYKDLMCAFKDIGIDIQELLDSFILFKRFEVKKCNRRLKSKKANSSWPSELSIILKNPVKSKF